MGGVGGTLGPYSLFHPYGHTHDNSETCVKIQVHGVHTDLYDMYLHYLQLY